MAINNGVSERLVGKHGRWNSGYSRDRYTKDDKDGRLLVTKAMKLYVTGDIIVHSVNFGEKCTNFINYSYLGLAVTLISHRIFSFYFLGYFLHLCDTTEIPICSEASLISVLYP